MAELLGTLPVIPRRYALTERDVVLGAALEGAALHLDRLARSGCWDCHCDAVNERLGTYGMGRN